MKRINFDHLACSPILPEVRDAMMPFLCEEVGNPLSWHIFGESAQEAVEGARENMGRLIGAQPEEIIFTSCGSESNNLAVKGIARAHAPGGKHIIASPIEHHSVIHPLKGLQREGYDVSWAAVDSTGMVDPEQIRTLLRKDTILISITSASNEIGTLEPIKEIGSIAREKGILFHTDAVACAGFVPIDVQELHVDLLSLAGNVFYGPQGTGVLYVRKGTRIFPLIAGGIQERGLRAGTHNVAGIVGMGKAAEMAHGSLDRRRHHLLDLRDRLITGVLENITDCTLTGHRVSRLPGHASFSIQFIEGESILIHLNAAGVAGTSGSTCSSQALKVSHVLEAIGLDTMLAQGSLVLSLGIENTREDISFFLEEFPPIVENLRRISPLAGKKS